MEDFERLYGSLSVAHARKGLGGSGVCPPVKESRAANKDVGGCHGAQIGDQPVESRIRGLNPVDVHDRIDEAGGGKEWREGRRLDAWMDVGSRGAGENVSREHCSPEHWHGVPAGQGADQQCLRAHCVPQDA